MDQRLSRFIDEAMQKGVDRPTVFLMLRASGWKEREIAAALAEREIGLPIPERAGVGSARDAFLHLLAFTSLYAWVVSLIYLFFTYIELWFPDPATRASGSALDWALSGIRAGLATIIVAYLMFLAVWWYLLREIRAFPEKAKGDVRRWLSFLSLFVGAVTLMSDVICTVYYLVEGELTTRFLLKVLSLFVVTGGIFLYLALVLRSESEGREMSHRTHVGFAVVTSLVVGFAVVWGFVLAGSPATRRSQLFDERRLADLQTIARAIENQAVETTPAKTAASSKRLKHPLPKTLDEAAQNDRYQKLSTSDPETGQPYRYTVVNPTTFTLCATFSQARTAEYHVFWNHPPGEHCFTINVLDPPP